jgi:uncharacterized OB-fold protein
MPDPEVPGSPSIPDEPPRLIIEFDDVSEEPSGSPPAGVPASRASASPAGGARPAVPAASGRGATCPSCGWARNPEDHFCSRCGHQTAKSFQQAQPQTQPLSTPPQPSVAQGMTDQSSWATAQPGRYMATPVPTGPMQPAPVSAICSSCGQAVLPGQTYCQRCGMPFIPLARSKDKTVAILLAIFLSFWTWLYTFERDRQKFWIGLIVGIASFFLGIFLLVTFFVPFGIWIWSIIDVCQKPESYYRMYPNG